MHILIFANCITPACQARRGNARYDSPAGRKKVLLLADYLSVLGHTVEIHSPSYAKCRDSAWSEPVLPGVTVHHAPSVALAGWSPRRRQRVTAHFQSTVRAYANRPDVLVVSYNFHHEYAAALLCAARECRLKTLLEYEDGLYLDPEWQTPAGRALERDVYSAVRGCLVVGTALSERVREVAPNPPACLLLPGLPDLRLLALQPPRPPPGDIRLLFAGNFGREQGFGQLCQWIEHLPDCMTLDITGRAGAVETNALQEVLAHHPRARFHGFLDAAAFEDKLDDADACVLLHNPASPYFHTQFPSKFFDCLSRNKRIVTAPDIRLAPFHHLPHLIVVENFPHGLAHLPACLRSAPPLNPQAVLTLGESLRRQLGEFISKI
ncbi:MAG: hypothetical protein ABSH19_08965 [Opitutales bacterium]